MDFETILKGLELLFSGWGMVYLVCGLLMGFIVGVLPGLDSVNGAALVLPFSFTMQPEGALLLIAGIYAGNSYAGSVPAILINVPGSTGAAATSFDGYPMALRGEGLRAINIARISSAVGGVVAALLVMPLMMPLSSIAIRFQSPEMALVGLLSLTVIGSVVGGSVSKGLASVIFGLLLASVAASPETGTPRFSMGFHELYEEFPFVPVTIGVFAFTQMFAFAANLGGEATSSSGLSSEERKRMLRDRTAASHSPFDGMLESFRYVRTLMRSTLLGLGIGILPGIGTSVSNFISYGMARRASKDPSQFGRGTPEGVVASEAADNAVAVGTVVPTFILGIPGSGTAALMLAAILIHGWQPGPKLMLDHGVEIYSVVWGSLFASILIVPIAMIVARPLLWFARLPREWLVPPVLLMSLIGAYALRNSLFDVALALIFGVIGIAMRLAGYPVVPMILGVIIGPLIEQNLIRSLVLSQFSIGIFFESATCKVLWCIFALVVLGTIYRVVERHGQATSSMGQ